MIRSSGRRSPAAELWHSAREGIGVWERRGAAEVELLRRYRGRPAGTRVEATLTLRFRSVAEVGGRQVGRYGLEAAMPVGGGPGWAPLFTDMAWVVGERVPL